MKLIRISVIDSAITPLPRKGSKTNRAPVTQDWISFRSMIKSLDISCVFFGEQERERETDIAQNDSKAGTTASMSNMFDDKICHFSFFRLRKPTKRSPISPKTRTRTMNFMSISRRVRKHSRFSFHSMKNCL